jgi:Zn-dependent protease with chaperone function
MAHELTHIALKHTTEDRRDGIFTGGVVFAAMTTAMALISVSAPLFAVAGLAAGLLAFDAYAGSVVARYNEKVCDRGAALMTGETVSLISGLTKMGEAMLRAKQLQDSVNSRNPKTKWQSVRDPVKKWWRKTSLFKKINHSHPDDGVRIRLLDGYGADGEDRHYLSWRAQQFRGAFLKAAVRPETVQPAAQAVARPAQTPAKPGIET